MVSSEAGAVCALEFADGEARLARLLRRFQGAVTLRDGAAPAVSAGLEAYFGGEVAALDGIAVGVFGTAFQRTVWGALRGVPAGSTRSYGAVAAGLGRPGAARAVGHANGANPVGIVVPCHRLVGADGSLTGYGGGLERKRWLLAHEARHASMRGG